MNEVTEGLYLSVRMIVEVRKSTHWPGDFCHSETLQSIVIWHQLTSWAHDRVAKAAFYHTSNTSLAAGHDAIC